MASGTFFRRRRVVYFALAGLAIGTAGAIAPATISSALVQQGSYKIQVEGTSSTATETKDVAVNLRGPGHRGTPTLAKLECTVTSTQGGTTTVTVGEVKYPGEDNVSSTIRGYGQVQSDPQREGEHSTIPNQASFGVFIKQTDGTQGSADGGFTAINDTDTFVSGRVVVRITGKLVHTITDSHGVTITRMYSDAVQCSVSPGPSSTAQARYDIE